MIDSAALCKELRGQRRALEDDLRARCTAPAGTDVDGSRLDADLRAEWRDATAAGRTADAYEPWRDARLTQAAVAWILACVFTRFCEDNGLVTEARLGGPGERGARARDFRIAYFRANPAATDRDWLRHVFAEVAAHGATAALFDRAHNPVWTVPISGDAATALLDFFCRIDPDSGALVWDFTDPAWDTRFLGDLYQDLSEDARKRYALLQTPVFVEEFILDNTLTPAIDEFGYREVTVIDPAAGSGHFLLGAFGRLMAAATANEPATNAAHRAQSVLDRLAGVDLNPYATAICGFRLVVAALRASGIGTLADAPRFRLHLATGDSLLHRPKAGQLPGFVDDDIAAEVGHVYTTEDAAALADILGRKYHVVVGNPPYITVKDKALNDAYRARYQSCHRKYALSVPFTELFFELARDGDPSGYVGTITANSFMKREFGKKLVENHIPEWDLTTIIDTSGAYIPGHGTPTVILFGRARKPVTTTVRAVLGIRGEPTTPADPAQGKVWRSIVDNLHNPGTETDYVSIVDLPRDRLAKHPWTLGGGGAADLADKLSASGLELLGDVVESIGFAAITGEDDAYLLPRRRCLQLGVPARAFGIGELVRDWALEGSLVIAFPYDEELHTLELDELGRFAQLMWLLRTRLRARLMFGRLPEESGLSWYEYRFISNERLSAPLSIAFAFVATHNHFVVDRGGKVFKQSAPVIKLPAGTDLDTHLGLTGLLDSAVACFWMQQVFQSKGQAGAGNMGKSEPWRKDYEFDGTKLKKFPLPAGRPLERARRLDALAQDLAAHTPAAVCAAGAPTGARLDTARDRWHATRAEMIATQEELDWECAHLYGLTPTALTAPPECVPALALGERAFEIVLARRIAAGDVDTTWFARHGSTPITEIPPEWPDAYRRVVQSRIDAISTDRDVGLVERPENKRRWAVEAWDDQQRHALRTWMLDRIEALPVWADLKAISTARIADLVAADTAFGEAARLHAGRVDVDVTATVTDLVAAEAVPFLAAYRYKDSGMRKREVWERTWALQRREDAGDDVGDIAVPPRYNAADFARTSYWRLRGKLDVAKERFVSYPGCGRRPDEVVVGWAGWDHLDAAKALAALVVDRRNDGWDADRLVPLLAGLAELEPWLAQYHDDVDPAYGVGMGTYFADWTTEQARSLGVTRDDLTRWRPATKARKRNDDSGKADR